MSSVTIHGHGAGRVIAAPRYRLILEPDRPRASLETPEGLVWSDLCLLASAHSTSAPDEAWEIGEPTVEAGDDGVRVVLESRSSVWRGRRVVLDCRPDELRMRVELEGEGRLDELTLLGGSAVMANGATGEFRSSIDVGALFVPTPTEPVQAVRTTAAAAELGVVGDAEPGRLHGVFSPPPLVLALGRGVRPHPTDLPEGDWLALSIVAPIERLSFTRVAYDPVDGGFLLRLRYDGRTRVTGRWTGPELVIRPAPSPEDALRAYRADLEGRGWAPAAPRGADWHREPIFCGWGAQCARAVELAAQGLADTETPAGVVLPAGAGVAPDLAREDLYDEWLAAIAAHGIDPGTVVIDDRWQAEYGTNEPDAERWPDLRGWIRRRHEEGRRVLLWFKAWDPGGLDPALCLRDPARRAVAVDPGNPAYLADLRDRVRWLLSPDGLDADGFKVDYTQRAPTSRMLTASADSSADDGIWGLAALHRLLKTLYDAAHRAKPDALVVTHAIHPSFGDVADMVRLNDVLEKDPDGGYVPVEDQLRLRHAVARAVLPDHPIDTDQWPMPHRAGWLAYAEAQIDYGVPALYYVESIDESRERVRPEDLDLIAETWRRYRRERAS